MKIKNLPEEKVAKHSIFVGFCKALKFKTSISKGIIVFFPILIIIFLLSVIIGKINDFGVDIIKLFSGDIALPPFGGTILIVLLAYIVGRILIWEQEHKRYFLSNFLSKVPYVGRFFTLRKGEFSQTCLFWWTPSIQSLGFIIGEQKIKGCSQPKIVVNFPNPPPTQPLFIEKRFVVKIGVSFETASQILATWNTIRPETLYPIPWDGELMEECLERMKNYPNY